jgi:predicted nuclease with TOPRIM domain
MLLLRCRKAEDESKIESLEVARSALEEKLRLAEAKKMKLEQRVSALTKQNAALAKSGGTVCDLS